MILFVIDDPKYTDTKTEHHDGHCTVGRINCVVRVEEEAIEDGKEQDQEDQGEEGKSSSSSYLVKEIYSPLD